MYKVYIDGELAWYPGDELLVLNNCELHLALNDSGTFEFDITSDSAFYDRISSRVTMVQVVKDDKELFYGEVRDISRDLYNVKHVYCVGELAFLFDSIQPQAVYHDLSPRQMLETWLNEHNSQVEAKKQYQTGIVTVHDSNDSIYRMTNRENTLDAIRDKLCDKLGGYLKIRKVDGVRYLDWLTLEDYGKICEQPIQFGRNLLDYSEDTTADDLYTKIIPLGARLDDSPVEGLEAYVDITTVNDGKDYLYIPEAVERYGWVPVVVHWDDVTLPENLKTKGEAWLRDNQYETMTLELNAVDLSVLSSKFDTFELGDSVHALAAPYGMDRYFPVQKLDIYLQEPDRNILVLGNVLRKSYTEQGNESEKNVNQNLDELKITSSFLQSAIDNATQMLTGSKGGYKVTEYDENGLWLRDLYMNAPSKEAATHIMQINMNGIGFSRDGFNGPYKNAWTIDGVLLGEFIKANSIQAEALSAEYKSAVTDEIDKTSTAKFKVAEGLISAEVERATGQEVEIAAALKVAADQISLKVDKGKISSQLSVESGLISIKGPRLKIDTDNFKLDTSGNVTANNASLSDVTMDNASITGGSFECSSGQSKTVIRSSSIRGYINNTLRGLIDFNANSGAYPLAMRLIGYPDIVIKGNIVTTNDANSSTIYQVIKTKTQSYISDLQVDGDGRVMSFTTREMNVKNGFMIGT